MKKARWVALLLVFCLFQAPILAAPESVAQERAKPHVQEHLGPKEVVDTMNQLFAYHVDQKQISTQLLGRSFKAYIDEFDPYHVYFLAAEVYPFLEAKPSFTDHVLDQYNGGHFDAYRNLDALIQKSIQRSRDSRAQWASEASAMLAEAVAMPKEQGKPSKAFALTLDELQKKQRHQVLQFIASEKNRTVRRYNDSKLAKKIVAFYEKKTASVEAGYLPPQKSDKAALEAYDQGFYLRLLKSLARSLDAHTEYFSPLEAYNMKVQLEKDFRGVGIVLQDDLDGVVITKLIQGGPADKSGKVTPGDLILAIDGKSTNNQKFEKILDLLRGEDDPTVTLLLSRFKQENDREVGTTFKVSLPREEVVMNEQRCEATTEFFKDGMIGKITLYGFYEGENGISSETDVRKAIHTFRKQAKANGVELKGIVLDLRQNVGGFLLQAIKVAGLFITNGVVAVSKYSDGESQFLRDLDGYAYYDGPLVILTSRTSASAAEIVAQALQDYGVAIVAGDEHTYGKGSIQHQTVTDDNATAYFKVTVGRYYTASGKSTQIDGVKVDIVVPTSYHGQKIGEKYLDFPLARDRIPPAYNDTLIDIEPSARVWFLKFYKPTLEKRQETWKALLPILKKKSAARIVRNDEYQRFIKLVDSGEDPSDNEAQSAQEGPKDLPMNEAVSIVKDMIVLQPLGSDESNAHPDTQATK